MKRRSARRLLRRLEGLARVNVRPVSFTSYGTRVAPGWPLPGAPSAREAEWVQAAFAAGQALTGGTPLYSDLANRRTWIPDAGVTSTSGFRTVTRIRAM